MALNSWLEITATHVESRLSARELAAYRQAAETPASVDTFQTIIDTVTEKIRGAIAACPKNKLGPAGQIPSVLLDEALAMITMRVMTRVGGAILDPGEQRRKEADAAEAMLKDVMRCEGPSIPTPTDGTEVDPRRPALEMLYSTDRTAQWTPDDQDGL